MVQLRNRKYTPTKGNNTTQDIITENQGDVDTKESVDIKERPDPKQRLIPS
jgi:hypothetical protein